MARLTPEDVVKNAVIKYLNPLDIRHGGSLLFYDRRNAGGPNYKSGLPDLWLTTNKGVHVEVEFKAPGGHLKADQERWARYFHILNTPYICVDNLQNFVEFLRPLVDWQ